MFTTIGAPLLLAASVMMAQSAATAPKVVFRVDPDVPADAKGTVVVSVAVGVDGIPREVKVTRPLAEVADERAVEAVRRWRFAPAMQDGKPVAGNATIEVVFDRSHVSTQPRVVALWPNRSPKIEKVVERGKDGIANAAISNIHNPSILVFLPEKAKATGASVIICPGGGHRYLAIDHEGYNIASWLNSVGVAGIILKYRLSKDEGSKYTLDDSSNDGREAIRAVRNHAREWGLDPNRIGIMGFSAGGEVAALAATTPLEGARPDFLALIYPGLSNGPVKPDPGTPPTFISFASDDNPAIYEPSVKFYVDLRKAGVPAEMHVFSKGGHGFGIKVENHGLTVTWTARFEDWMRDNGWLKRP